MFAAFVSRYGHAFIDRALYLPKAWTDDRTRMATAHVPRGTGFRTKPQLAAAMIERAIAAGVPFSWVAGDSIYGVGEIETALRRACKGYVLGVNAARFLEDGRICLSNNAAEREGGRARLLLH